MSYTYEYPRPALTADTVVFGLRGHSLRVCLVERGKPPFAGQWAMPGGFVEIDERIAAAARRELREETGLEAGRLHLLGPYDAPDRDPRGRVISVAYVVAVGPDADPVRGGDTDDAARAAWHDAYTPPPLAFDHGRMLSDALAKLRELVAWTPTLFRLIASPFSAEQVSQGCAAVRVASCGGDEVIERARQADLVKCVSPGQYVLSENADALMATAARSVLWEHVKRDEDEA